MFDLRLEPPPAADTELKDELRLFSLPAALVHIGPGQFTANPLDVRAALAMISDASEVLRHLLAGGRTTIAGRLAGAFRNIGRDEVADTIVKTIDERRLADGLPALGAVRRPQARPGVPAAPPPRLRRAGRALLSGERRDGGSGRARSSTPRSAGRCRWSKAFLGHGAGGLEGCTCAPGPRRGLRSRLRPDYRIGCKRLLFSNDWYPALSEPNVDVVTDRVAGDHAGRCAHRGRRRHEADVLVHGTGFTATDFLAPWASAGSAAAT